MEALQEYRYQCERDHRFAVLIDRQLKVYNLVSCPACDEPAYTTGNNTAEIATDPSEFFSEHSKENN